MRKPRPRRKLPVNHFRGKDYLLKLYQVIRAIFFPGSLVRAPPRGHAGSRLITASFARDDKSVNRWFKPLQFSRLRGSRNALRLHFSFFFFASVKLIQLARLEDEFKFGCSSIAELNPTAVDRVLFKPANARNPSESSFLHRKHSLNLSFAEFGLLDRGPDLICSD